jgi:flavin-dependent dehydrogenase
VKKDRHGSNGQFKLEDGSRVGIIGGGPAGSFFSYFLLDIAERIDLDIKIDIYEPRNFFFPSPMGCNMCGGIISESLVQNLATEGINLPPEIVQRGIDSYTLHTNEGSVEIGTPLQEKRIAAVHRGCGPKDVKETKWGSFDGFLQVLVLEKGANLIQSKVENVQFQNGLPEIIQTTNDSKPYDLVAVAVGINSSLLNKFTDLATGYKPPQKTRTLIREFYLGEETIAKSLGNSMHVFLMEIPGLEFAAIIPKGDYVTLCMLGRGLGTELLDKFLKSRDVIRVMPEVLLRKIESCKCSPSINISGAIRPYSDRMVYIGDSGVTRLYKDGIGAAYRTAKAAANTVIFEGIGSRDFQKYYWPVCRKINQDNFIGRIVFMVNKLNQKISLTRATILRMVREEQQSDNSNKYMSLILWDMFTGSSPYLSIFLIGINPVFLFRFMKSFIVEIFLIFRKN